MTTTDNVVTGASTSVQIEVIGNALESICEEMGEALVRTSYSPNIKERRDCTTGLFDAEGRFLAQAEHIPMHLGSLMGIVQAVLDRYPLDDIKDGDSFVGNDPHTGGGTHLPDIVLITPIFVDGVLTAWATNLAHHCDYAERGHEHTVQDADRRRSEDEHEDAVHALGRVRGHGGIRLVGVALGVGDLDGPAGCLSDIRRSADRLLVDCVVADVRDDAERLVAAVVAVR